MNRVRLGAVGYLNTRPLVYGLDRSPRFDIRFDVPSQCAVLLHEGAIDVGLIPSIEYLHGGPYRIVPHLSLASRGAVDSVAVYTAKPMSAVRSIAMDTSSRTSVALVRVLCAHAFGIQPRLDPRQPDVNEMLLECDAALIIGDNALFLDHDALGLQKIDLGDAWFQMTGRPFVYAFWAGRAGALCVSDVRLLQQARDAGVQRPQEIARQFFGHDPHQEAIAARYLRDNMKYGLGDEERAGLELFYRYADEIGIAPAATLRFYDD